ncbi:MAG TPA: rod shape-determining protein MreC [Anaerolineaceae bacterium]|nr:rod shape-determining protein MreC [Anaerolineaceae bacterium]
MNFSSPGKIRTVAVSMFVIGLLVLALGGFLNPLLQSSISPFVSIQTWVSTRFMALYEFFASPTSRDVASLRQQNAELEAQLSQTQAQVIELQQQLNEAQILYSLLDFARQNPENRYTAATVIGREYSPLLQLIYIEHGSDHGLRRGMPVVTTQGLVGRVDAVTATAARVRLITDASSAVNVRLKDTQTEAIMTGSITGDLTVDMVPQDVKILPGELIVTSGLGGTYPENLVIGQVVSVRRRENDLFQTASIQPVVDFSNIKVVLVITNFNPVDITPLVPKPTP